MKCWENVRYWTVKGITWASESLEICDADDTAMGFHLLRLHGYPVSSEVFKVFKKGDEFFCIEGQTSQAVTGMHSLYRASQTMLPGESILEDINQFTRSFLIKRQMNNEIRDKWIISKGLKAEVEYTLNNPWYQSLPRIEAKNYIDHYGVDDVWIGKSLYRMFFVNNQVFLSLAKADYSLCQSIHQREFAQLLMWYDHCQFNKLTFGRQKLTESFFSIAATLFEPEYSYARNVWAKCSILTTTIDEFFDVEGSLEDLRQFLDAINSWDPRLAQGFSQEMKIIFLNLYNTLNIISQEAFIAQGRGICPHLRQIWVRHVTSKLKEAEWKFTNHSPTLEEYMHNAKPSMALECIVKPTIFFVGERISEEDFQCEEYDRLMDLVNIVGRIKNDIQNFYSNVDEGKLSCVTIFLKEKPEASELDAIQHFQNMSDQTMRLIVREYLQSSKVPKQCKQVHFYMAKILNLFYNKTDGFRSLIEMSEYVNATLYTPTTQYIYM